ncbi:hypothetical protein KDA_38050 [Dictyobacter alpinus]|uniref:Protein kinase domain-containing protein n=1 Tax=Dictyobacter alpinus TaxID=2014873 RepID=A0A402BAB3_9CHLR|nr:serine/threonine-protein kinase [Dictyobacter alpinus]GCE28321.1 hypothetical protein KDA_38050 [Dictyobacter alpinus]
MASSTGDLTGQRLGNYQLKQVIGQGGFAEVYLGEHVYLKTLVAIKVLSMQLAREDQQDFLYEARTIANLKHPNIVSILELGVQEGTPFLVMDYAANGSLRERYRRHTHLTPITVLPAIKQVAAALQFAHQAHIMHRDIKPENMLLDTHGEVLLSDFGMALGTQSSRAQNMQAIAGTVAYMAPEVLQGRPVAASDQYALGIVLYEWLSGDYPFHGTFTEIASQQVMAPPPTIKTPAVSPEVEAVILRALAKRPEQRFESVQAFADAFEQAILDVAGTFRAPSGWRPSGAYQQIKPVSSPIEPQPTYREEQPTLRTDHRPAQKHVSQLSMEVITQPPTKIVKNQRRLSRALLIMLSLLALLIVVSGLTFAYVNISTNQPDRKVHPQGPILTNNALPNAAAWQRKYEQVASSKPALTDPLKQNVNGWANDTRKDRSCLFAKGAYHTSALIPYAEGFCGSSVNSSFHNIGYQVQMIILRGNEGGLYFRFSAANQQVFMYIFSVNRNGSYNLWAINGHHYKTLLYRSSPVIKTGLNQPNLLCVIAQEKQIALYINKQYIASVVDSSATSGYIGLLARSLPESTEVAFNNLTVWSL